MNQKYLRKSCDFCYQFGEGVVDVDDAGLIVDAERRRPVQVSEVVGRGGHEAVHQRVAVRVPGVRPHHHAAQRLVGRHLPLAVQKHRWRRVELTCDNKKHATITLW